MAMLPAILSFELPSPYPSVLSPPLPAASYVRDWSRTLRSKVRHSNLYSKKCVHLCTHPMVWTRSTRSHQLEGFMPVYRWLSSTHTTTSLSIQPLRLCRHSTIPVSTTLCKPEEQTALQCYWGLLLMPCGVLWNQTLTLVPVWLSPFLTLQCPLWPPWERVVTSHSRTSNPGLAYGFETPSKMLFLSPQIRTTRYIW